MTEITSSAEEHLDAILSSVHGGQRRKERNIAKQDLRAAVKFGIKEPAQVGRFGEIRWKYTFADVVFITDKTSTKEVTSWVLPACGVDLEKVPITAEMQREHELAVARLTDMSSWTSHSVMVVDQSGSMRNTDATGGVTRSDLTWLTLAIIMVGRQLKNGERKSSDVFSLVDMRDIGVIRLRAQPYDWILYNALVDFLRTTAPLGSGNYLPALGAASSLLFLNTYGGCALMLTFLSDGRPSDKLKKGEGSVEEKLSSYCCKKISKIASRLGSRLTVGAISLGNRYDDFAVLQSMLKRAKEYGCHCFFQHPSLSAKDLVNSMTWLSSSVTSTMVRMTDVDGKRQRQYKKFVKETLAEVGTTDYVNGQWTVVPLESKIVDGPDGDPSIHSSIVRTRWIPYSHRNKEQQQARHREWSNYRRKDIFHSEAAVGVAQKKKWFGEGAERLVKEFREVDKDGYFVGPAMVAKSSKYIMDKDDDEDNEEKKFHKAFIKTQQKAQHFATIFNRRIRGLQQLMGKSVPCIEFLDCSVYMLATSSERRGYLVEKMLDIKRFEYKKWNDNAGRINQEEVPLDLDLSVCEPVCSLNVGLELFPICKDCSETEASCEEDFDQVRVDEES